MNDEELLAQELGKLGALSAKLGGILSGESAVGKVAGMGASLSVQLVSKFLPTETFTHRLSLKHPVDKVLRLGFSILRKLGTLKKEETEDSPYPCLKAVVGSGFFNMNPAVVYFEILEANPESCEVTITAAAKEGIIKQKTARKAVLRIVEQLNQLL